MNTPDYQKLGTLGAKAAKLKLGRCYLLNVEEGRASWEVDEPARTAFAAAVVEEDRRNRLAEISEGMPKEIDMIRALEEGSHATISSMSRVRNLMLAAFAKKLEETKQP